MTSIDKHVIIVPRPLPYPESFLDKRIRTVEDVYSLFQLFINGGSREIGRDPPFKFVYGARVDTGIEFNPYYIIVVPRGRQPINHYVISPTAVVHVRPGHPSEIYGIQQWIQESNQFQQIRNLTFFKSYLKKKMFRRLVGNLAHQRYMRNRTKLGKTLFLSKGSFAKHTDTIKRLLYDLQLVQPQWDFGGRIPRQIGNSGFRSSICGSITDMSFMRRGTKFAPRESICEIPIGLGRKRSSSAFSLSGRLPPVIRIIFYPDNRPQWGYSCDEFLSQQQLHFLKVLNQLQNTQEIAMEKILVVVQSITNNVNKVVDVHTLEQLDELLSYNSEVTGPPMGPLYHFECEMERQRRKRHLKKWLVEYDILPSFIVMADILAISNLYKNVVNAIEIFTKHLELPHLNQHRELRISFRISVIFNENETIKFSPDLSTLHEMLKNFIWETITRISNIPLFQHKNELKVHMYKPQVSQNYYNRHSNESKVQHTLLSLRNIMENDACFCLAMSRLASVVERDYNDASEKAKGYEPCRNCINFLNIDWPKEYGTWPSRAEERDKSKCLTDHEIKKYIIKVFMHKSELKKLSSKQCGILSLFIDPLLQDLVIKLDTVTENIKTIILNMTTRRMQEIGKSLDMNIALINSPPLELPEFNEWIERLKEVEAISESLIAECDDIEGIFALVEEYNFVFPQHVLDKRQRTTCVSGKMGDSLRVMFINAIVDANKYKNANHDEIHRQLDEVVAGMVNKLNNTIDELLHGDFNDPSHKVSVMLEKLRQIDTTIENIKIKRERIDKYCELMEIEKPSWEEITSAKKAYKKKQFLWSTLARWEDRYLYWNRTPVSELDGEDMRSEMVEIFQTAHKLNKAEPDGVTSRLLNAVTVEKAHLNTMVDIANPALKEEHWIQIFDGINKKVLPKEVRTLETLRSLGLYHHSDIVAQVAGIATGEYVLVKQINKIAEIWDKNEFILVANRDQKDCLVLGGLDDILTQLEEHQVQVQTCLASRYVGGIRDIVEGWDTSLQLISDVLDEWSEVQKAWVYLEFVFSSDDIKKQLPEEMRMFQKVNKTFRNLIDRTARENNVLKICTTEGLLDQLRESTGFLDKIQKGLEDYLETKRVAFPRFYFLSNDELISILSDVRNPTAVQPHLQKCFDNIKELEFIGQTVITAMKSTDGEVVPFSENIKTIGEVEVWLNEIERMMRKTLYDLTKATVEAYPTSVRNDWYFDFPAQCICTVDQIVWTQEIEEVWDLIAGTIDSNGKKKAPKVRALDEYIERYKKQILDTVSLVKGKLTNAQRTCVCTLIVIDVHQRDVTQSLIDDKCQSGDDFNWQKQLRYYWGTGPGGIGPIDCHIHHSAARFTYGYEYLGNQLRLVITPLTERAFLTCTSALHIFQGAAPQGPAGTGKTESVKDLGKALARQVVVFNCSDGLNYRMMSQMFAGLAQAGAWACFDEFNRIEIEVLSVVAQQMLEITTAIGNLQNAMVFDGHKIRLHKNFGVFITMNPGYAGRTELPDNLKALFRPICMMIPDYSLIAEIMFFSEGFCNAKALAQKMVRLYSLASQQLSKQDHYDFGMRAVKSILVMAGQLKRKEPDSEEDMILIRAMRDSNVPKFLRDDTILFLALINDLFPDVKITEVPIVILKEAVENTLSKNGHQVVDLFTQKVLQLYETMVVRHGVMLVGQTLTGKTTNAQTLSQSLTHLNYEGVKEGADDTHKKYFTNTKIVTLNPKSITMGEMYGDINRLTREWHDGVLSSIVRDLVKLTTKDRYWVNFDGPVDAIWIENMNTVLDDNKLLCLVNGERIKIPDTISFLFEVEDLRVASPATVSRCGMVFMETYYLNGGWLPIATSKSEHIANEMRGAISRKSSVLREEVHSIVRRRSFANGSVEEVIETAQREPQDTLTSELRTLKWHHSRLIHHLGALIPPALAFLRSECSEFIGTCDAQLVMNLVDMLHSLILTFINEDDGDDVQNSQGTEKKVPPSFVGPVDQHKAFDMLFAQCFIWSIGGNTNDQSRGKFSTFAQQQLSIFLPLVSLPVEEGLGAFDYFVHKKSLTWQPWSYKVPAFNFDPDASYFDLLVPTTDTIALSFLLGSACHIKKHVIVNGVTGTGKSSAVAKFVVNELQSENIQSSYATFSITFSAQTTSYNLQETIENKLVRRRGDKEIGPQPGKKMVGVIDDCNMPQLEVYGASPPIELLRQIISQGGFYDRKKLNFKEVIDVIFIACCGEPGGGKNEMTSRLTSKMLPICLTSLSTASMKTIFNSILGGFLQSSKFNPEVINLTEAAVGATVAVYNRITDEMLPTPERTHYTFNLRDVSKVIQGILQITPKDCKTPQDLLSLWVHESSRVFHDRLINDNDREWWEGCVSETVREYFNMDWERKPSLLYGSWADKHSAEYKEITDQNVLHDMLREYQVNFNASEMKDVDLVLFDDAVCHLARICRILRQPRGNALLVGVGGSGRHSLCELAAYISVFECRSIVIVRNYGINEFRDDVKKILLESGARGKSIVFLLSDNQLIESQMLEDVNNLLNIGEVPGLMGSEEYEVIMTNCRDAVKAAGKPETRNSIYQFFVSRCRDNLHIILCMSPIGAQFRDRLRMFPSLVNCMTIDWYTAWPHDALLSVAKRILANIQLNSDREKKLVCEMAVYMHTTVIEENNIMYHEMKRTNSTTPTNYLNLLSLYIEMYTNRLSEINADLKRYQNGVDTLISTNKTIETLKEQVRQMQPILAKAAVDSEKQKKQLAIDKTEGDKIKNEVSIEEAAAQKLMDAAEAIKKECADGLELAMPALRSAEEALNTLSAKDIQEIKVFASPPANVSKTLDAVLTLLGKKEGWASAKLELGNIKFLQTLQQYDKDSISANTIRKLKKFIVDKEFIPEIIEKTSVPCKSLCMWVHAMDTYYHVAKEVAPKRQSLMEAQEKVDIARAELDVKQAHLAEVVKKVEELERMFRETVEQKENLEKQIKEAEAKLGRADQLINGLANENTRWHQNLVILKEQRTKLVGTMCLASGAVAYLGPFVSQYRSSLLDNWTKKCKELEIPVEDNFTLEGLVGQYLIREWALEGLPLDPFSIENAAILKWSKRWCLMIDPQGQANHYIRKKETKRGLKIIKLSDDNYMRTLESAIQIGAPVLLENVGEELDAALDPVLLKQVIRQGGRTILRLGEKEVEYDPLFCLYITTKYPNPVFTPELQIKVNVVNFTVTRKGLEDQQLCDVVAFERADLQAKSDQCVVAIATGKNQIKGLEDKILMMLANSTGDILDNISLIETLNDSKNTSDKITKDLEVVERTNAEIEKARETYRVLATRGSLVYKVVSDLSNIDPMYQYSLQFFKKLFISTLERSRAKEEERRNAEYEGLPPEEQAELEEKYELQMKAPEEVEKRVNLLIPAVTWTSYSVVCRGLFEKDKLLLSFMLTVTFQQYEGLFKDNEWDFFLRGGGSQKIPNTFPTKPMWLDQTCWADVAALSLNLPQFSGIEMLLANDIDWHEWVTSDRICDTDPPNPHKNCSEWERAILIKSVRPEKLVTVMRKVVETYLAKQYCSSPQFSLKEAFADSNNMTPLIFVLSSGTDPTAMFTAFAEDMGYGEKKLMLSLGQDQGIRAVKIIDTAQKQGLWAYLQNCHVYESWMPTLERIVERMRPEETHPDFRLWLTSSPSAAFPVPVLQSGMKLTKEPPKGLKANLLDFIHQLEEVVWEENLPGGIGEEDKKREDNGSNESSFKKKAHRDRSEIPPEEFLDHRGRNKNKEWKRLLFTLAFFHALLQERRKFSSLGWNIPYEWNAPDFSASIKTLRITVNDFEELPWTAIKYTIGVINYGGRVTDFLDGRCLQNITQRFFDPKILVGDQIYYDDEKIYSSPNDLSTKEEMLKLVESYPQFESPELFGLHANAEISFQIKEARVLTKTLIDLQPRGGGVVSGHSPDEVVLNIAEDLLVRLPATIDADKAHPTSMAITESGNMISLGTVLKQEIDQFNTLLKITQRTLKELKKAIKGEVVMSTEMESMYNSFLFNFVPDNWKKKGYLCLKPLSSYYIDLIARINFISSWCYNGPPKSFWLSGFFFPQGFITGVYQTHSRKHGIPVDCIKFEFHPYKLTTQARKSVSDNIAVESSIPAVESGAYCHGFFLDGASWRNNTIQESTPGQLFDALPPIHFQPVPIDKKPVAYLYDCPLYKASTRAGILSTTGLSTNFVLMIQLPSQDKVHPSHWINRGVAALCMLDH